MSPKNKGKFGKGKSQVEETDEFVSGVQRIGRTLRPYAKKIAITLTVVVLGVLAITVWGWWKDRKAKAGTEMYVAATDVMVRQVVAPDPAADDAGVPAVPTPDPDDVENEQVTYASLSEQAEAELEAVKALNSKYGGSPAAKQAELLKARALLDLDRYDDAIAAYRSYASKAPTELLKVLAREGEGYALEAKAVAQTDAAAREAGLKEALAAFQRMQTNETGVRRKHAIYHEARLLATLGDGDKALELYRKLLEIEPPPGLEETVNARIASLEAGGAKAPAPTTPEPTEPAEPGSEGGE